jgi:hypothetical protein
MHTGCADKATIRRAAIVCVALAILFFRAHSTFATPQLWAEDGVLYRDAYNAGWHALLGEYGGTLNLYGSIVGLIATKFAPQFAPWVEVYAAHLAALTVVAMATSPRFALPYRALVALGIVCAPAGTEVLGFLASAQWVLPIGLVVLLYSTSGKSSAVFGLEVAFAALAGLTGPIGLFVLPLYIWQSWHAVEAERRRLVVLTGVLAAASALQVTYLFWTRFYVFQLIAPVHYPAEFWVTAPLRWLDAVYPAVHSIARRIAAEWWAVPIVLLFWVPFGAWLLKEPYREMKCAMAALAYSVLYLGMLKYRNDLNTIIDGNGR